MPQHERHNPPIRCIAILGATATGKSELAIGLAERIGGEIVSMDSRQVYRGMDIGTAKVMPAEQRGIPHHLIDILNPDETNSAGRHAGLARSAVDNIAARGRIPILAGGTGLYFRALFEGLADLGIDDTALAEVRKSFDGRSTGELYADLQRLDASRARRLSPADRMRITRALEVFLLTGRTMSDHFSRQEREEHFEAVKLVLTMPRVDLRDKIARRTMKMFQAGWIDEVTGLLAAGYHSRSPGLNSLGYKEISGALEAGTNPRDELETIIMRTRQYGKRQETFFRQDSDAHWIDVTSGGFERDAYDYLSRRFDFKNNLT
jgi:tRNA dimethylallyltransferase